MRPARPAFHQNKESSWLLPRISLREGGWLTIECISSFPCLITVQNVLDIVNVTVLMLYYYKIWEVLSQVLSHDDYYICLTQKLADWFHVNRVKVTQFRTTVLRICGNWFHALALTLSFSCIYNKCWICFNCLVYVINIVVKNGFEKFIDKDY